MLGGKPAAGPLLSDCEGLHGESGDSLPERALTNSAFPFWNLVALFFLSNQHYSSLNRSARLIKGEKLKQI